MTELRKSPLIKSVLKDNPIIPRQRNIIDIKLLKQDVVLKSEQPITFDFQRLLNGTAKQKRLVYKLAKALKERLQDNASVDTEYGHYNNFLTYWRYCESKTIDPFSKEGFLRFCSQDGELQRRIDLADNPLPFIYLYEHGAELGTSENKARHIRGAIVIKLTRAEVFSELWLRDTIEYNYTRKPTPAYSQVEYNTLLRRVQFLFFSITSQLVAAKEKGESIGSIEAVFDELDDGSVQTITLHNTPPGTGDVNHSSPFNTAMALGYYLFCHYTNLNTSAVMGVRHPIVESEYKKAHRTTKYVTVKAFKSRANKIVVGTFVEEQEGSVIDESSQAEQIELDIDKRDGLTVIQALAKLSLIFYPDADNADNEHPPLFYALTKEEKVTPLLEKSLFSASQLLTCYTENRSVHAPYLIDRFDEVVDNHTITHVKRVSTDDGAIVVKETVALSKIHLKQWVIALAYAALRALTDIPLKNIYMPLHYSDVDHEGNVTVSFKYQNGKQGEFAVESRYVSFLKKLENYSNYYNPVTPTYKNRYQKLTPYLLPLGRKNATYQWDTLELPIARKLRLIGIYSGEYLLDINAQRFRATGSNHNIDLNDGGLSVATLLLQNQLNTLRDHYLKGDVTQNQVIASQAIDVLHDVAKGSSLEEAKENVKARRGIDVLEHDEWKALRMPTNTNGILCDSTPSDEAEKEHRASQRRAKNNVDEQITLKCYQYDKCIICKSAKLVNDVPNTYKLLSFIELLEDASDQVPEREEEFSQQAGELMLLATQNLSEDVLSQAEDKLAREGRHPLHDMTFLSTMTGVKYDD